jgi:DNA-directed RNA polymerase specialized sigma24 family protein
LLAQLREGNREAADRLVPLVYNELRRMAGAYMQRQSRLVELRFFAGLDVAEAAEVMGVSPTTIKREWRSAKAWLQRELAAAKSG